MKTTIAPLAFVWILLPAVCGLCTASEAPASEGLVLDLDANDPFNDGGRSLPADGTRLDRWLDRSMVLGSQEAINMDKTTQPAWRSSGGPNGKCAIVFAAGDRLSLSQRRFWRFLHDGSPHTVFIVFKTAQVNPEGLLPLLDSTESGKTADAGFTLAHESRTKAHMRDALFYTINPGYGEGRSAIFTNEPVGAAPGGQWIVASCRYFGFDPGGSDDLEIGVNGARTQTLDSKPNGVPRPVDSRRPLTIGGGDGIFKAFEGSIARIMIYNRALDDAQFAEVEAHLIEEYLIERRETRADVSYPSELSEALQIGGYRQLFVDNRVIDQRINMKRVFNQVRKHETNPILMCDQPWERGEGAYIERMTLVRDERDGLLKMWYQPQRTYRDKPGTSSICYATSRDGLTWEKPILGMVEHDGSKENNICGSSVFERMMDLDPNAVDPARRFKGVTRGPKQNFYPQYSADGMTFTRDDDSPTGIVYYDDASRPMWDPQADSWVFYRRHWSSGQWGSGHRLIGVALSRDFKTWNPTNKLIFTRNEHDAAAAAERGAQNGEFYSFLGWPYEGMWFGGLEIFWRTVPYRDENGNMIGNDDGPQDMHLAWTRDLRMWHRRQKYDSFIPLGDAGAWDSGMIYGITRPILVNDEIWFYYNGFDCDHYCVSWHGNVPDRDAKKEDPRLAGKPWLHEHHEWNARTAAIGLATLRLDGFVHLETNDVPGLMTTRPLVFTGRALGINATANDGAVRVEIRDESGKAIPGFGLNDCDVFSGDSVRHTVTWNGKSDLTDLYGRVIQLHVRTRRAKLYAFWFVDGGTSIPTPAERVTRAFDLDSDPAPVRPSGPPPDEIRVSHILIAHEGARDSKSTRMENEALELANQLLSNIMFDSWKFDGLARSQSDSPASLRGGDLGLVRRGQLDRAVENAAFQLGVGQTAGEVVQTPEGFHIIRRTR